MLIRERELTEAQHRSLDRIHKADPNARVIGWDAYNNGPIIGGDKVKHNGARIYTVGVAGYKKENDGEIVIHVRHLLNKY